MELIVRKIGNSKGVILSKEMLVKLGVSEGDKLYASETPDGYALSVYDAEFARAMEVAEQVMREHRHVLRKLAE